MNIVLFEPGEWRHPLPVGDVRAKHLTDILKLAPEDTFAAGEIGGLVGSLTFVGEERGGLIFDNPEWTAPPPPLTRVVLLIGTPRPPTARRLLKDLTTLGAAELHFAATDLGDKSYLQSTLWKGEFELALREGAAQARTTLLPRIERHQNLRRAIAAAQTSNGPRVYFDEGGVSWDTHPVHQQAAAGTLWLALGPERGWSAAERELLTASGWQTAGLGPRTLRTETACALALGIAVLKGWS
jgi:RsmE family RNA methyltransferase